MNQSNIDKRGRYIIDDYSSRSPFSSFLPGISGPMGIPMWVFYVNRGQGITSFGVENKNNPIMEFQPANKAYRYTSIDGFRTFIKFQEPALGKHYEPFSPQAAQDSTRKMFIGMNELEIQEENAQFGLKTNAVTFIIPGENHAALSRTITIQNRKDHPILLEILDGVPAIIPYGVNDFLLKNLSRTIEAWMEVFNVDQNLPFYRVRASIEDKPEVETFQAGHFALAFVQEENRVRLQKSFIDPAVVFGQNTSTSEPNLFARQSLQEMDSHHQISCGKTPCAFFGTSASLQPSESIRIFSLYGHIRNIDTLNQEHLNWTNSDYIKNKRIEANQLTQELTDAIFTSTNSPEFDGYCRQTFLDNLVRGGWPVFLGNKKTPYYIYSRKHGDLERDYNDFSLAAEFFSQGNGNYRDVNQNRRSDVLFSPEVGNHNIHTFASLIQADGYNPLVVHGSSFTLTEEDQKAVLALGTPNQRLENVLSQPFTPGKILMAIIDEGISLPVPPAEYLDLVIDKSEQHFQAEFGEGYWTDHWTYILDLIESYLTVFPDRKISLLFEEKTLPFYDSAAFVRPRDEKYILTSQGPRQLNSIWDAPDKEKMIRSRRSSPNLLRTRYGLGQIYYTDLFSKLVILALIKFTTLDPQGMGIEMEAGKPGWYDAMNGLPGLFGSTLPETFELKRLIQFLSHSLKENNNDNIHLPVEVVELFEMTSTLLRSYQTSEEDQRDFIYWDQVTSARERYREKTRLGFDGEEKVIHVKTLEGYLKSFLKKLDDGIQRALDMNDGIPPTYFTFQVEEYSTVDDQENERRPGESGFQENHRYEADSTEDGSGPIYFRPKRFNLQVLPLFLEGPVRAFKVISKEMATDLHQKIRESELLDRELNMYKVNASLQSQPQDIGRARAFPPGWLENESIWLHMEYKYLLEVLKAGLYGSFFDDFNKALVPFLDTETYKRSPLENSSFLVSSAHPDQTIHGAGFIARLSGSTAEFLSIWHLLMAGKKPFSFKNKTLLFELKPILPGWLFAEDGKISFRFLGRCIVTYHNPGRLDTYNGEIYIQKYVLQYKNSKIEQLEEKTLGAPFAEDIRDGKITRIDVFFKTKDHS